MNEQKLSHPPLNPASNARQTVRWTVSIVSHGHGRGVTRTLLDLHEQLASMAHRFVLTLNDGEDPGFVEALPAAIRRRLTVIRNEAPRGFAANHNAALKDHDSEFILIADPDLSLPAPIFANLEQHLSDPRCGIVSPIAQTPDGVVGDNGRGLVTPAALLRRYLPGGRRHAPHLQKCVNGTVNGKVNGAVNGAVNGTVNGAVNGAVNGSMHGAAHGGVNGALNGAAKESAKAGASGRIEVDWLAGLFLAMSSATFRRLGGFDEGFRLYCEDVDLCLRTRLLGLSVHLLPDLRITHPPSRNTLKRGDHFVWHVRSLFRLWRSGVYREARQRLQGDGAAHPKVAVLPPPSMRSGKSPAQDPLRTGKS